MQQQNDIQRSGRRTLMLLAAVFFVPSLLGVLLVFGMPDMAPEAKSYGHRLSPVKEIQLGELRDRDNKVLHRPTETKWTIAYIAPQNCETKACFGHFYRTAAFAWHRLASKGKNLEHIRLLFITSDKTDLSWFDGTEADKKDDPVPHVVIGRTANLKKVAAQFKLDEQDPITAGRTYIIDRYGRWSLYYNRTDAVEGIFKDVGWLIKYAG